MNLRRRFQGVDVLSLDVVELNEGVPGEGGAGGVDGRPVSLHAGHGQEVSLGAPLGLNICGAKEPKKTFCVIIGHIITTTDATACSSLPFSPERITAGERSS